MAIAKLFSFFFTFYLFPSLLSLLFFRVNVIKLLFEFHNLSLLHRNEITVLDNLR